MTDAHERSIVCFWFSHGPSKRSLCSPRSPQVRLAQGQGREVGSACRRVPRPDGCATRPAVLVLSTPNTHVVAPMTPVCGGLHGARGVPTGAQARGPFKGCLGPFRCARDGYVHGFTSRIASRFAVVRCKTCAGLSPIPHLACNLIVE